MLFSLELIERIYFSFSNQKFLLRQFPHPGIRLISCFAMLSLSFSVQLPLGSSEYDKVHRAMSCHHAFTLKYIPTEYLPPCNYSSVD